MLEELQVVKHNSGVGIIVPDPMGLWHKGYVMVDFDNAGLRSCANSELEIVGRLKVEFDTQKCEKCVFASSLGCHRYSNGMLGWLPGGEKRIPKRIYPHCQSEHV
jgi:hypothetical protein